MRQTVINDIPTKKENEYLRLIIGALVHMLGDHFRLEDEHVRAIQGYGMEMEISPGEYMEITLKPNASKEEAA